jgi:hypothetical protein
MLIVFNNILQIIGCETKIQLQGIERFRDALHGMSLYAVHGLLEMVRERYDGDMKMQTRFNLAQGFTLMKT